MLPPDASATDMRVEGRRRLRVRCPKKHQKTPPKKEKHFFHGPTSTNFIRGHSMASGRVRPTEPAWSPDFNFLYCRGAVWVEDATSILSGYGFSR